MPAGEVVSLPRREATEARRIAEAAGTHLLALRTRGHGSVWALRDEADKLAHDFIVEALMDRFPGDAILSEEGADGPARLEAGRVWIVDPLDGTREYGEAARRDWAVHVAFWEHGVLVAGAVALPAQGLTYATDAPPTLAPAVTPPRVLVSRSRPHALARAIAGVLGGGLVPMGSAGAKAMAVVQGAAEIYAHAGGMYEWDSAAPAVVAAAAGLHTSRLDGRPLAYNMANPWLPDLLICRPEFTDDVLRVVRDVLEGGAA